MQFLGENALLITKVTERSDLWVLIPRRVATEILKPVLTCLVFLKFILFCFQACNSASSTMQENNLSQFDILRSDCLTGLTDRLTGLVDLLICNPPYVETQEDEEGSDDIRFVLIVFAILG